MSETVEIHPPSSGGPRNPKGPPPLPPRRPTGPGFGPSVVALLLVAAVMYGAYFWFVRRVVVNPGEVMVLLKKDGHHSLASDQIVIPRPPDQNADPEGYKKWREDWSDTNGVLEQVYLPGTYFAFSPFDYEREVVKSAEVPSGKVGVVFKRFGKPLPQGHILADPTNNERGPLPVVLQPGQYPQYANPYAYELKLVDPINIDPGHRGVVTVMAGPLAANPNQYLVDDGTQGTQRATEPEGFRYINPYEKRVTPVSIQSQRFEMAGGDAITFPSSDSFEIKMEGFVEWSIIPDKLPLIYVQYAEGAELLPFMEEKVILPYARSFSRIVGSQYTARDFISGDTKLKFQSEFEQHLRKACEAQGIEILQALVRDIVPPVEIKQLINEREVAKQQIKSLEQQITVAKSQAQLATQLETGTQNQAIGEANKKVVTVVKKAEQDRDVAVTKAQQELAVAKLRLEAAKQLADATVAKGQADAAVILLNRQAEAEPLRQQVAAFGDGSAFAQYYFYQKVAPSIKSIMASQDGPFADMFKQFVGQQPQQPKASTKVTGVQP